MIDQTKILNTLIDYSVGTLWFVKEALIKIRVDNYDQNSTREGHPTISIRKKPIVGNERIPMLIGSSKPRGNNFLVEGVFEKDGATWFGSCLIPLIIKDFLRSDSPPPPKNQKDKKKTFEYRKKVAKNRRKPKLSQNELKDFKKWLVKRGYWYV